jgi:hypothetical protein
MELDFMLKFFSDLGDKIEKNTRAVLDYNERLKRPALIPYTQTTQLNGSGYGIMDLGGPPAAYMWIVRLVSISDQLAWTNSMGSATCQFGVGNIPPESPAGVEPMAPNTVRWPFATLPNVATFSTNHFTLYHGDRLYCQIQSGTANEYVQATAGIEQWLMSAMRESADIS